MIEARTLSAIAPSAEALRPTVRAFLDEALKGRPPDRLARSWMGFDAEFSRALAQRGWVGLTLPAKRPRKVVAIATGSHAAVVAMAPNEWEPIP